MDNRVNRLSWREGLVAKLLFFCQVGCQFWKETEDRYKDHRAAGRSIQVTFFAGNGENQNKLWMLVTFISGCWKDWLCFQHFTILLIEYQDVGPYRTKHFDLLFLPITMGQARRKYFFEDVILLKCEMHKKACEHFLSFFPLVPPWKL